MFRSIVIVGWCAPLSLSLPLLLWTCIWNCFLLLLFLFIYKTECVFHVLNNIWLAFTVNLCQLLTEVQFYHLFFARCLSNTLIECVRSSNQLNSSIFNTWLKYYTFALFTNHLCLFFSKTHKCQTAAISWF